MRKIYIYDYSNDGSLIVLKALIIYAGHTLSCLVADRIITVVIKRGNDYDYAISTLCTIFYYNIFGK